MIWTRRTHKYIPSWEQQHPGRKSSNADCLWPCFRPSFFLRRRTSMASSKLGLPWSLCSLVCCSRWYGLAFPRPDHAPSFFEFEVPTSPRVEGYCEQLDGGLRCERCFHGRGLVSAPFSCHPKTVGWIMIATSAVAYVDGFPVCWIHERGEWNHCGTWPVLTVIGTLFLDLFYWGYVLK